MDKNKNKYSENDLARAYFIGIFNRNIDINWIDDLLNATKNFPKAVAFIDSIKQETKKQKK